MTDDVRAAYLAPYDSWANRIAVLRFVQDIPLKPEDPSYTVVSEVEEKLPRLRDVRITRYWAGVIDMSPDGLPILDGATGVDGLVVVTGLSGHGLALGPAIGRIAAELATDGRTTRAIEAFSLRRFTGATPIPTKML